jgi:hypothetical protein
MSDLNSFESGTAFLDSITAGVFSGVGNATSGVPTGVPLIYAVKPKGTQNILTNPDTNPLFATAKGAYVNLNNSKLATPFVAVNGGVALDVCRLIAITANVQFSCFVSCRDFYGEKMTFGGASIDLEEVPTFNAPRGVTEINSIKVFSADPGIEIQVKTLDIIELPYADLNSAPVTFVNYNDAPLLAIFDESSTPYRGKPAYLVLSSIPGSQQTKQTGNVRPLLQLNNTIEGITLDQFNGNRILVVGQNVNGYGFNLPVPTSTGLTPELTAQEQNPFLNLSTYVLGDPSYSVGWEGWQK